MLNRSRSCALALVGLALLASLPACTVATAPPDAVPNAATVKGPPTRADLVPECRDCRPWQGVRDSLPSGGNGDSGSWCASTGSYVDDPASCPELTVAIVRVESRTGSSTPHTLATSITLIAMLTTGTERLERTHDATDPDRPRPLAVWAAARWLGLPMTDEERRLSEPGDRRQYQQHQNPKNGSAEPDRASG